MRLLSVAGLVAILLGQGTESMAQFSSCPGGVCYPPEAQMARSRVRVTSSARSGARGGLLSRLFGRRQASYGAAGGVSAYGSTYGAAYGAPEAFSAVETFGGGGSCYSSQVAPMGYSPYSTYSVPSFYSAPPPAIYSTPQSYLEAEDYELVPIRRTLVRPAPARQRLASRVVVVRRLAPIVAERTRPAPVKPERRPTAVAVRPRETEPGELPRASESLAKGDW